MNRHLAARILHLYISLPDTPERPRKADRALARRLAEQVACEKIEAALYLGQARRLHRDPATEPLPQIRSLHYFLPVLDEVLLTDISPSYLAMLERRCAAAPRPSPAR